MPARVLLFHLDELRRRYGRLSPEGADPRTDTSPFRSFRGRLLAEAARTARGPASLTMWWEGSYNGYCLAVALEPAEAAPDLDAEAVCPLEHERLEASPGEADPRGAIGGRGPASTAPPGSGACVAMPRREAYPLGRVAPGRAAVARDPDGTSYEAPFGAPAGHFGAPGMRRLT